MLKYMNKMSYKTFLKINVSVFRHKFALHFFEAKYFEDIHGIGRLFCV